MFIFMSPLSEFILFGTVMAGWPVSSRSRAWQAVNTEMVACYWQIGRLIIKEEQRGETRAAYGKGLIKELSIKHTDEFGRGFHQRNLWFIRNFYLAYPKVNALRSELSRTHYRLLLRVEKPESRAFYEAEAEELAAELIKECRMLDLEARLSEKEMKK
jgi:hypothetical protein